MYVHSSYHNLDTKSVIKNHGLSLRWTSISKIKYTHCECPFQTLCPKQNFQEMCADVESSESEKTKKKYTSRIISNLSP